MQDKNRQEVIPPSLLPIARLVGNRDEAIRAAKVGFEALRKAAEAMNTAHEAGAKAGPGFFRSPDGMIRTPDVEVKVREYTRCVDEATWKHLLSLAGFERLMDVTALESFRATVESEDVPPVTMDNVLSTLEGLYEDRDLIFQRGLATAFTALDRRFKSHDAFKIGSRMVFTHVFGQWGSWNYDNHMSKAVTDVERVFAVLDGEEPQPGELREAVTNQRGGGMSPRQGCVETRYFRIRSFKNGNAHLWFTRKDLVLKANRLLAEYYGAVLPDAVPRDAGPEKTTALCKGLAFYRTPPGVIKALLRHVSLGAESKVLEPSAGEGDLVEAIARAAPQAWIWAVEVDPGRAQKLRAATFRGRVTQRNFLKTTPRPDCDAVIMNPPFSGTHWMSHVMHAWDFLAPGGDLVAVLPATAEVGSTKKHEAFRAWAANGRRGHFFSLPAASFASSGTRVSTVILTLRKKYHR